MKYTAKLTGQVPRALMRSQLDEDSIVCIDWTRELRCESKHFDQRLDAYRWAMGKIEQAEEIGLRLSLVIKGTDKPAAIYPDLTVMIPRFLAGETVPLGVREIVEGLGLNPDDRRIASRVSKLLLKNLREWGLVKYYETHPSPRTLWQMTSKSGEEVAA